MSVLFEKELEQFFDTALVKNGEILCVIHWKVVAFTEDRFAGVFELPTEGLIDLSEVPQNLVFDARRIFSKSGEPIQFSFKKRLMKYEFRLLNDILAKLVTVKAGSFDAVTQERFLMMTAIHFGVKVNWSKLLFEILQEMDDKSTKRAKGFVAQICVLLKGDPTVTLGEAKPFPPLKIFFCQDSIVKKKSVSKKKYASTPGKDTDEAQVEIVAEKAVSKKQPATASDAPVVKKKKTTTGNAATAEKYLTLVVVAQEAVPIQIVEPISAVPTELREFKKGVRAQSGIFTTELADIRNEIRYQSKEFDDKLDAIRNDLLEFRVETQEQYTTTLRANLAELIAFVTRGCDDKKGEVGSIHGRGQPPPEDRRNLDLEMVVVVVAEVSRQEKEEAVDGGSSGSRSEPSRTRGSSGSKQRDWRYWING
ncbi:hypothetical protein F511_41309 [Dorcoceras hygrometricum]|uniref:Uncharacterized protein n=1 Tax=Dorcoceras hygrometricum TaxID=472368 RepID=A0A2Z7CS32_9LAMI|nr:hypothetical protein F511_41309 [Dorcoceras hygrometricum]